MSPPHERSAPEPEPEPEVVELVRGARPVAGELQHLAARSLGAGVVVLLVGRSMTP